MSFLIGIGLGVLVFVQIINGVTLKYHKLEDADVPNFDIVNRKDNQGYFWLVVLIQATVALVFVLGIIRF